MWQLRIGIHHTLRRGNGVAKPSWPRVPHYHGSPSSLPWMTFLVGFREPSRGMLVLLWTQGLTLALFCTFVEFSLIYDGVYCITFVFVAPFTCWVLYYVLFLCPSSIWRASLLLPRAMYESYTPREACNCTLFLSLTCCFKPKKMCMCISDVPWT